ncbi:hypothetical protein PR048_000040 [Dryococelus australis]|uniref:Uncharacterized protein n=1 Tax=Dryococelus australis TaxID=614101 RepID=A0ABQ9IDI6_9NEOP|nr:hypothetical protein PR048_000040 [Dryococelus australis]
MVTPVLYVCHSPADTWIIQSLKLFNHKPTLILVVRGAAVVQWSYNSSPTHGSIPGFPHFGTVQEDGGFSRGSPVSNTRVAPHSLPSSSSALKTWLLSCRGCVAVSQVQNEMELRRNERAEETADPRENRPVVYFGTIPNCENPGVTQPGIETRFTLVRVSLDRRMDEVMISLRVLILHKAAEYTSYIQEDLKQGFQNGDKTIMREAMITPGQSSQSRSRPTNSPRTFDLVCVTSLRVFPARLGSESRSAESFGRYRALTTSQFRVSLGLGLSFLLPPPAAALPLENTVPSECTFICGQSVMWQQARQCSGAGTTCRSQHVMQHLLDPKTVPFGDGKYVVVAHAEPPRLCWEQHPLYSLTGSGQRDAVQPLPVRECGVSLEHHSRSCWRWRYLVPGAVSRFIDGKTARQFSALRLEAMRVSMRHVSVAPSAPTLVRLRCAKFLQPGGQLTKQGARVAERLTRSPPTKANWVQSPAGSPDLRKWESCRTMPLVAEFSRGSPFSPAPSLQRRSIFTSITLIGSQDLTSSRDCPRSQLRYYRDKLKGEVACSHLTIHKCCRQPRYSRSPHSRVTPPHFTWLISLEYGPDNDCTSESGKSHAILKEGNPRLATLRSQRQESNSSVDGDVVVTYMTPAATLAGTVANTAGSRKQPAAPQGYQPLPVDPYQGLGAVVAERLDCSPLTKANRIPSRRIFASGIRGGRCRWSGISRFPRPCISALLHSHPHRLSRPRLKSRPKSSLRRIDLKAEYKMEMFKILGVLCNISWKVESLQAKRRLAPRDSAFMPGNRPPQGCQLLPYDRATPHMQHTLLQSIVHHTSRATQVTLEACEHQLLLFTRFYSSCNNSVLRSAAYHTVCIMNPFTSILDYCLHTVKIMGKWPDKCNPSAAYSSANRECNTGSQEPIRLKTRYQSLLQPIGKFTRSHQRNYNDISCLCADLFCVEFNRGILMCFIIASTCNTRNWSSVFPSDSGYTIAMYITLMEVIESERAGKLPYARFPPLALSFYGVSFCLFYLPTLFAAVLLVQATPDVATLLYHVHYSLDIGIASSQESKSRWPPGSRTLAHRMPVRMHAAKDGFTTIRPFDGHSSAGMQGRRKREIPEETRRQAASSGTIPTCESPEVTQLWWEASSLSDWPLQPPTTNQDPS